MRLSGARALITGGASGLGEGTAQRFVANGARVALLDLPSSRGPEVAAELGDAVFAPADVTNTDDVEQAVAHAAEAMGGIDILVNAAGVVAAHRVVTRSGELFPLELFEWVLRVNLIGAFDVVRRTAGVMAQNEPGENGERGVIVNVASIAAFEGQVGQAAYSASKGGIAALTITLARDLASIGVRVNTIAPGIMDTPMMAGAPDELRQALADIHVFPKRLGRPDDFASLAQHMVENELLNGEIVRLDAATRMQPK
ncbi:MAG TPA: SDR family NAD(P)-dependent oxidoreductase [Acidimicrobiia bacterium]|nr:SDR family NAD(P)-dependent oxidoreductase [Acidimicrobiia bacterium]